MANNFGQGEKTEKNVVGKRNETDIGGHNRKAGMKSGINTINYLSKQSLCKKQLWWAAGGGPFTPWN